MCDAILSDAETEQMANVTSILCTLLSGQVFLTRGEQIQVFSEDSQSHMNRIPNLPPSDLLARD